MLCCVARAVALLLVILSSSLIAVTVAPLARVRLVFAVIPPPSAIVIASSPSVNETLAVLISPVVEISPEEVMAPVFIAASVRDKSPVVAPVNEPVPTVTLSSLSSHPINTLVSLPRSITIPASPEAEPVTPLPNSIILSVNTLFVVETVVVVPVTVKSPSTVTLPLASCFRTLLKRLPTRLDITISN